MALYFIHALDDFIILFLEYFIINRPFGLMT
jgi:hypothetical protein